MLRQLVSSIPTILYTKLCENSASWEILQFIVLCLTARVPIALFVIRELGVQTILPCNGLGTNTFLSTSYARRVR